MKIRNDHKKKKGWQELVIVWAEYTNVYENDITILSTLTLNPGHDIPYDQLLDTNIDCKKYH